MKTFLEILAFVAFLCAFVVWHGEGFIWFVVGAVCMAVAVWAGAKVQRADEEENNPII